MSVIFENMAACIRFEKVSEKIVRLTLNRPERSNAFSLELLTQFSDALDEIRADSSCRILVLTAEGKNCCGGLDLSEAAQSDEKARKMPALVVDILAKLHRLPQTVIAAVRGAARAGGAALAVATDLVVASDDFNVAFPEIHRGLEPILLFPLLRRKLSGSALSELLLTGQPIDAYRAWQLGIVHRIVQPGHELEVALKLAEDICKADSGALRTAKELILVNENSLAGCSLEEEFAQSLENHVTSWFSASGQEGIRAFLEKRNPNFKTPDFL